MATPTGIDPEYQEQFNWDFFLGAANGNESAARFLQMVFYSAYTWDHIVDKEDAYTKAEVDDAFHSLTLGLAENEFYLQHRPMLHAMLANAITQWHVSNRLKKQGTEERCDQKLVAAYCMRSSTFMVATIVSYITGGLAKAVDQGMWPWLNWTDTFEDYKRECYGQESS